MRISNRSTVGSETSVSTSTGSRVCPRPGPHRSMAPRIQRGATKERAGWADARWLCQAARRRPEYSHRRTLNRTGTESGGTSRRGSPSSQFWIRATVGRSELGTPQSGTEHPRLGQGVPRFFAPKTDVSGTSLRGGESRRFGERFVAAKVEGFWDRDRCTPPSRYNRSHFRSEWV